MLVCLQLAWRGTLLQVPGDLLSSVVIWGIRTMCSRDFGSKSRGPLIASGCVSHDNLQALNTFDVPLWMRDPQSAAYCAADTPPSLRCAK